MPVFAVGIMGGLWAALEMRSREAASAIVVLGRALGLILRHGGMLLSGVILIELLFAFPGIGRLVAEASSNRDGAVLGTSAALLIWLALLSRFSGNLLLAAVEGTAPAKSYAARGTDRGRALAIGGTVTVGLLVLLFLVPLVASEDPRFLAPTDRLIGPSGAHLFGTDQLGRDIFSRVLHGGRTAAQIGLRWGCWRSSSASQW